MQNIFRTLTAALIGISVICSGIAVGYLIYEPVPLPEEEKIEIPPLKPRITGDTVIKYIRSDGENSITAPYYMVGLTKTELEQQMSDWTVESFSPSMVVLNKTVENGYTLGVKDGYVAVFRTDGSLKEMTNKPFSSLSEEEQENITSVTITTEEELNRILEGLES